jgi:hypothetical protein
MRLAPAHFKQYLYNLSCDPLYAPTPQEEAHLAHLLADVRCTDQVVQSLIALFCSPRHRPMRWDVWRGIYRTLARIAREGL